MANDDDVSIITMDSRLTTFVALARHSCWAARQSLTHTLGCFMHWQSRRAEGMLRANFIKQVETGGGDLGTAEQEEEAAGEAKAGFNA